MSSSKEIDWSSSDSEDSCDDADLRRLCRNIEHKTDAKAVRSHHECECSFENATEMLEKEKASMGNQSTNFNKLCGVPTMEEVNSHLVTTESVVEWPVTVLAH